VPQVYNIEQRAVEPVGGAARFAGAVRRYAAEQPLVLFSGDCLNPSLMSAFTRGEQMVPVLNSIGVHAAAVGNHDCEHWRTHPWLLCWMGGWLAGMQPSGCLLHQGMAVLAVLRCGVYVNHGVYRLPPAVDFGIAMLQKHMQSFRFPWLLSNVLDARTGEPLGGADRSRVIEWQGVRVGLMGLVEPEVRLHAAPALPACLPTEDCCLPACLHCLPSSVLHVCYCWPAAIGCGAACCLLACSAHRVPASPCLQWLLTIPSIEESDITFLDFCTEGRRLAGELREAGADIVVALTHMRTPNDLVLAAEVPEIQVGGWAGGWVGGVARACRALPLLICCLLPCLVNHLCCPPAPLVLTVPHVLACTAAGAGGARPPLRDHPLPPPRHPCI
jgi:hypothetical protein